MVSLAKKVLENKIKSRDKPLTHFISLSIKSLNHELDRLYQSIPEHFYTCNVVKPKEKLHLTVSVLSLSSANDGENDNGNAINKVIEIMQDHLINISPFTIELSGVSVLKGTPKECKVLVSNIQNTTELDRIFRPILHDLVSAGLATSLSTLWHCTLFNTRDTKIKSFDATSILSQFKDTNFGQCTFGKVHLSRFSSSTDPSGYYESHHTVSLNHSLLP